MELIEPTLNSPLACASSQIEFQTPDLLSLHLKYSNAGYQIAFPPLPLCYACQVDKYCLDIDILINCRLLKYRL